MMMTIITVTAITVRILMIPITAMAVNIHQPVAGFIIIIIIITRIVGASATVRLITVLTAIHVWVFTTAIVAVVMAGTAIVTPVMAFITIAGRVMVSVGV